MGKGIVADYEVEVERKGEDGYVISGPNVWNLSKVFETHGIPHAKNEQGGTLQSIEVTKGDFDKGDTPLSPRFDWMKYELHTSAGGTGRQPPMGSGSRRR